MKGKKPMGLMLLGCLMVMALCQKESESVAAAGQQAVILRQGEYSITEGLPPGATERIFPEAARDTGYLALVDEDHPVAEGESRSVRGMVGSFLPVEGDIALNTAVIYALCDMQMEYPLEKGAVLIRGHMSPAQQDAWQQEAIGRYRAVGRSQKEAEEKVPSGGCSEHQLGLALDVRLTGPLNMGKHNPLLRNETGQWMAENMHRFGFVYAEDAACEEIHLRYVGRHHAAMMKRLGLTMAAYRQLLQEKTALTLWEGTEAIACVQWVEPGQGADILPGMTAEVSSDNRGHYVVYAGWE